MRGKWGEIEKKTKGDEKEKKGEVVKDILGD